MRGQKEEDDWVLNEMEWNQPSIINQSVCPLSALSTLPRVATCEKLTHSQVGQGLDWPHPLASLSIQISTMSLARGERKTWKFPRDPSKESRVSTELGPARDLYDSPGWHVSMPRARQARLSVSASGYYQICVHSPTLCQDQQSGAAGLKDSQSPAPLASIMLLAAPVPSL